MPPCTTCNDEDKENCTVCSLADDIPLSQQGDIKCVCGSGEKQKSLMQCKQCERWWHAGCVGLAGLTKSIFAKIEAWKCPLCFSFSPQIKEKLVENGAVEKVDTDILEETVEATDNRRMHRDILEIKDILTKQIVPNTQKTTNTVSQTLDANWRRHTQSWADIVAGQKALETKLVQQQEKEKILVQEAINSSRQKTERDNAEREKRKRNVVIRDIEEPTTGSGEDKYYSDLQFVMDILELDQEDIVDLRRAGPLKRNYHRPLVITVRTPELAAHLHNYGVGRRKHNTNDESEVYWVNPDLIETDRKANYQARVAARAKRGNRNGSSSRHLSVSTEHVSQSPERERHSRHNSLSSTGRDRRGSTVSNTSSPNLD